MAGLLLKFKNRVNAALSPLGILVDLWRMKTAKIKDEILKQLLIKKYHSDCKYLSEVLQIPFETIYALAKEMEDRNHVETVSTATVGHPRSLNITLLPPGEHFIKSGGYTKESRKWNWVTIATWIAAITATGGLVLELIKWLKQPQQ